MKPLNGLTRHAVVFFLCVFFSAFFPLNATADSSTVNLALSDSATVATTANAHDAKAHAAPAAWSTLPFLLLLLMIATGPLFYAHFWHRFYPLIAAVLGAIVVGYYLFILHDTHHPVHSLAEYVSFISLLTALFVASGGILINIHAKGTPALNAALLVIGALIANVIGTTGASMLLIRPFLRINKERIKPYHVVFFIFIVSNVGGCLTPIGDPPLFLGFLKGVPFSWTLTHLWSKWLVGVGALTLIFFFIDKRNTGSSEKKEGAQIFYIRGGRSALWLAITIGAVFLDPNIFTWLPAIHFHGDKISFVREALMLATAFAAYKTADKESLKGNEFNFEPIKEVAYLFVGIFATMMPALQLISAYAKEHGGQITKNTLYWASGLLSSVLDNAPTYLNFLAAGLGRAGADIMRKEDVEAYANGLLQGYGGTTEELIAVSVASVFFGALTYIGNAPNFMVKAIAEQSGIQMPSFAGYVIRYSFPVLIPVLTLVYLIFVVICDC